MTTPKITTPCPIVLVSPWTGKMSPYKEKQPRQKADGLEIFGRGFRARLCSKRPAWKIFLAADRHDLPDLTIGEARELNSVLCRALDAYDRRNERDHE